MAGWYPEDTLVPLEILLSLFGNISHDTVRDLLDNRLAVCVEDLDRAVAISECTRFPATAHGRNLASSVESIWKNSNRATTFAFAVAGGYVVDRLLGYGPYDDIDIWFQPVKAQGMAETTWILASARSFYPCNVMMVNDIHAAIETFDLHICQCAIECTVYNARRCYQFLMTKKCYRAWCRGAMHSQSLHPALAQPRRLSRRILKYLERGLHGPDTVQISHFQNAHPGQAITRADGLEGQHDDARMTVAVWEITVSSSFLHSCAFQLCTMTPADKMNMVASDPVLVFPCDMTKAPSEMAWQTGDVHWLQRALEGSDGLVGVRGNGRYDTAWIKPAWLLDRKACSCSELISDLRQHLGSSKTVPKFGYEKYRIRCSVPATYLQMIVDWKVLVCETRAYTPSWIVVLDSCTMRECIFCCEASEFCAQCGNFQAKVRPDLSESVET
jgi:hypothetical protein